MPVLLYCIYAAAARMGASLAFRMASSAAFGKALEIAYDSAPRSGSTLADTYNGLTRAADSAEDWVSGQNARQRMPVPASDLPPLVSAAP